MIQNNAEVKVGTPVVEGAVVKPKWSIMENTEKSSSWWKRKEEKDIN